MILEAAGITCAYGGSDVLSDVSLYVDAGEFVAIAGPNGSGKTTLLRALSRVLQPRTGAALLEGRSVYGMSAGEVARSMAVVPQETAIDFDFTVREIVMMGRAPHLGRFQTEGEGDVKAVEAALERTGCRAFQDRSILELSGGERQRVILARAFAQEPKVLLLDEPTAHLDLAFQIQILRLVRELRDEKKTAVLAAMHDLNLAATYADRMVLLSGGRVKASGPPGEVLTEVAVKEVFGADVMIRPHPETGGPWVIPKS